MGHSLQEGGGVVAVAHVRDEQADRPVRGIPVTADDREPGEVVTLAVDQEIQDQARLSVGCSRRSSEDLRGDGPAPPVEDGAVELGVLERGRLELGAEQVGSSEIGPREIGVGKVGSREIGVLQVGLNQVGMPEVGASKFGISQIGPMERCSGQVGASEVGASEEGMIQSESAKIGVPEAHARSDERVDRSTLRVGLNRGDFVASPSIEHFQRMRARRRHGVDPPSRAESFDSTSKFLVV